MLRLIHSNQVKLSNSEQHKSASNTPITSVKMRLLNLCKFSQQALNERHFQIWFLLNVSDCKLAVQKQPTDLIFTQQKLPPVCFTNQSSLLSFSSDTMKIFKAPKAANRGLSLTCCWALFSRCFKLLSHCFWTVNLLSKTVNSRFSHRLLQDCFRTVTEIET